MKHVLKNSSTMAIILLSKHAPEGTDDYHSVKRYVYPKVKRGRNESVHVWVATS